MTAGYGVTFFRLEYDLTATLNFSYMGQREITKWSGPSGSANLGESKLCSSTVASLALKKNPFNFEDNGKVDLKVDVNNLFNKYYELVSNYPAPGRNFYVGLHYSY